MSTQDINAGKPQREWVLSAGTVIPLYGKRYMVAKSKFRTLCKADGYCCAFHTDDIGSITDECKDAPRCHFNERDAVGGDAIHFVEVD